MQAAIAHPVAPARGPALVDPYLRVMGVAAAGVLAVTLWAAWVAVRVSPLDLPRVALFVGLALSSYMILSRLVLFDWRGQRVALAPDEVLVFVALLALPAPMVVLFAVPAMVIHQVRTRRTFLRAASNVAVLVLASAAGAVSFSMMQGAGVPLFASLPLALVLYTGTTHLLVSSVFALREDAHVTTVFRERFLVPTALNLVLALSAGVAIVGLWMFHPLAPLALAPAVYLGREHIVMRARAEREERVNKRLREVSMALAGERDVDAVAQRVLETCGELLRAGRAEIVLNEHGRERRWTKDFEGGPHPATRPLAASLSGVGGKLAGALVVHANRRTDEPYQETDGHIIGIVAAETGAAIANARALRDLDQVRQELMSSRVARPLVRRIVRSLMEETKADSLVLLRLGETLAREADAKEMSGLLALYGEMGLGELTQGTSSSGRREFTGKQLFEARVGARATTCYLALGYLCGTVSSAEETRRESASAGTKAKVARGTEVTCVSRGDDACRFVVNLRDADP